MPEFLYCSQTTTASTNTRIQAAECYAGLPSEINREQYGMFKFACTVTPITTQDWS